MRFLKSFSIYTSTNLFSNGLSFLTLTIFTHYLSVEEFGILSLLSVLVVFILPFLHLSFHGAFQVEFYKMSKKELSSFFTSGSVNVLLSLLIFLSLFLITGFYIQNLLGIAYIWVIIVPILAFFQIIPVIISSVFQISKRPINFGIYNGALSTLNLILGLVFVVLLSLNWQGRVLSWITTYFILSIIGLYILKKEGYLSGRYNKRYRKSALNFGMPLIFHSLGAIIVEASDKYFLKFMIGVEEVGLYSVAFMVGNIIAMLQNSFVSSYTPFLFERLKVGSEKAKIEIVKISYLFIFLLLLMVLALYYLTPYIYKLFDKDYIEGSTYVIWIAIGYFLVGCYKIVVGYIFYLKKIKFLAYIAILNIVLNLILNYFMIDKFGAIGAAYATVISNLVTFVVVAIISQRIYPMPWFSLKILLPSHKI